MSFGRHGAPHPLPHALDIPRLGGAARDPDRARAIEPGAVRGVSLTPLLDGAGLGSRTLARQVLSKECVGGGVHTSETRKSGATPNDNGVRGETGEVWRERATRGFRDRNAGIGL